MLRSHLPFKTKIAVWWIFVAIVGMAIFAMFLPSLSEWTPINPTWYFSVAVIGLLFASPGILLYFKNKSVWIFSIVILSVSLSFFVMLILMDIPYEAGIFIYGIAGLLILVVPFTLIILDRKNYFEMVRQRESEKKDSKLQPRNL